ncbi:MAG: four helix bundle protein [Bacteroidota bacterium]
MHSYSNFKSWAAYQKSYALAKQIFLISKNFPKEERYSLTDQIRRSSRSVCANLAEAFAKRIYPKHFVAKISDSAAENYETQTWLDFALDSAYLDQSMYSQLTRQAEEVGKILTYMQKNPSHYSHKQT